jgi:hypothetical protein
MFTVRQATLGVALFGVIAGCGAPDLVAPLAPVAEPEVGASPEAPLPPSPATPTLAAVPFGGPDEVGCLAEGSRFGDWTLRYTGYGCVALEPMGPGTALFMAPTEALAADDTHAPLAVGPLHADRVTMRTRVETVRQVRVGGDANPWEVAWVVWQYQDDDHFYYFIPKPNGWELGKRDPAYPGGQRFLATGEDQRFPVGQVYDVLIEQVGPALTVSVDGRVLVRFTDTERPYLQGRFALYAEDAAIRVHGVEAQSVTARVLAQR